jgi:hypothetical protein
MTVTDLHHYSAVVDATAQSLEYHLAVDLEHLKSFMLDDGSAREITVGCGWAYAFGYQGLFRWNPDGRFPRKERIDARTLVDVWFSERANGGRANWREAEPRVHAKRIADAILSGRRIKDPRPPFPVRKFIAGMLVIAAAGIIIYAFADVLFRL